MRAVWIQDQETVRALLTREHSPHEMRKAFFFDLISFETSSLRSDELMGHRFMVFQENCKAVADEYIECELMVRTLSGDFLFLFSAADFGFLVSVK